MLARWFKVKFLKMKNNYIKVKHQCVYKKHMTSYINVIFIKIDDIINLNFKHVLFT